MLRRSTRKLLDLVQREQMPLVIFGHDGEQWQTLKKAPTIMPDGFLFVLMRKKGGQEDHPSLVRSPLMPLFFYIATTSDASDTLETTNTSC
ncbi:MAG TPA: hypothetical protein VF043_28495 [Ktedonobacteraceae bacterium]